MLSYEKVFSRVRGRITDPKELSLDEEVLSEIYIERLHMVIGNTRIRAVFSSIVLDDENQEIEYAVKNVVDGESDEDYVCNLLALGMTIEWLQPQVDSIINTAPFIGGKEEKKILDNHSNMVKRLSSMKTELQKLIRDHGSMYNSYIEEYM